jgi:hypothetical protein
MDVVVTGVDVRDFNDAGAPDVSVVVDSFPAISVELTAVPVSRAEGCPTSCLHHTGSVKN